MKKYIVLLLVVAGIGSLSAQSFINRLPTVATGIKGCNKTATQLKVLGHDDATHAIGTGVSFELLNLTTIKDKSKTPTLKVKIIYDYNNTANNGLIGYLPVSATSLVSFYNESAGKIVIDFKNIIPTQTTGWKGVVTFDGLPLWVNGFTDTTTNLPKGTKVELLNSKMARTIDCLELCYAKFKVLDGAYAGKIGYAYAALTDFDTKMDYTGLVITGPPSATTITTPVAGDETAAFDLPEYPTERTGITGTVNIAYGAYSYEDGSDWVEDYTIPENSTFVLLNKKVFYDILTGEFFIKTKITFDPNGTYTGKVMWLTILDTSLSGRFNQDDTNPVVN